MRRVMIAVVICGLCLSFLTGDVTGEKASMLEKVRAYRTTHEHKIIGEFMDLLSIPNVSADTENIRKNAIHIKEMMIKRGIDAKVLESPGNPVVVGDLLVPGAKRTLLFYVHYDGQPVDLARWTDSHPFKPVLRPGKMKARTSEPKPMALPGKGKPFGEDWRIYARGASDDKAPIIAILTALDALKAAGMTPKNNLKFVFEGEEEAGSPNLAPFLAKHKDLFKADVLFMCDGPAYFSGDPTLFFGVRGITSLEITVYGPNTSLHSGHYGNWAPNPGMLLSQLLASMKNPEGNVLIKGFYDTVTPLSEIEKKVLKQIPGYEEKLRRNYGFNGSENPEMTLMETLQIPSLNINGLRSGWVGAQARTIVPPIAIASIDIRLVKGNDPRDMTSKVINHIKKKGFHVVSEEPDQETRLKYPLLAKVITSEKGYKASRTSMDLPISKTLFKVFEGQHGLKPVVLPSLGGSLPIYIFEEALGIPFIGVSIVNYDNNQHQPNENIRIGHLWKGIELFAAILSGIN